MASHKITITNGQVEGLNQNELSALVNFAMKNPNMQQMIAQAAPALQESVRRDKQQVKRLVESGKISRSDGRVFLEDLENLDHGLQSLREGFLDNAKAFGQNAYAKAGVAMTQGMQAVGKAAGNILGWMKNHPKLTAGLAIGALMFLGAEAASASTLVQLTGNQNLYATSGADLQGLLQVLGDDNSKELHQTVIKALGKIGNHGVLVMPDGSHFTGNAQDICNKILDLNDTSGVVLLSHDAIPATGDTAVGGKVLRGLLQGSTPLPK